MFLVFFSGRGTNLTLTVHFWTSLDLRSTTPHSLIVLASVVPYTGNRNIQLLPASFISYFYLLRSVKQHDKY